MSDLTDAERSFMSGGGREGGFGRAGVYCWEAYFIKFDTIRLIAVVVTPFE